MSPPAPPPPWDNSDWTPAQRASYKALVLDEVPDLTGVELIEIERRVGAFVADSDPARVADVAARHIVLSYHALRHLQRRELGFWALDRLPRASLPGRPNNDGRVVIGPAGRACIREAPRLAAILDVADAAVDFVEALLDAASLTASERQAALLLIVAQLDAKEASGYAGRSPGSLENAKARAGRKVRALVTDHRKVCPTCWRWFDWQRTTAVYCSDICRLRAHRSAHRAA